MTYNLHQSFVQAHPVVPFTRRDGNLRKEMVLVVEGKLSTRSDHGSCGIEAMPQAVLTSALGAKDLIDAKLERRRKGVFGPPMGRPSQR